MMSSDLTAEERDAVRRRYGPWFGPHDIRSASSVITRLLAQLERAEAERDDLRAQLDARDERIAELEAATDSARRYFRWPVLENLQVAARDIEAATGLPSWPTEKFQQEHNAARDEQLRVVVGALAGLRARCLADFCGGHSGAAYEAFTHGMETVCNVVDGDILAKLRAAAEPERERE
jgi:hypothetical protein